MEFINLATTSLGMINAIETFTSVFNLYLVDGNDSEVMTKVLFQPNITNQLDIVCMT